MTPGVQVVLPGFYFSKPAPTPVKPGVIAQVSFGLPWWHNSFGNQKLTNDSGENGYWEIIATSILQGKLSPASSELQDMINYLFLIILQRWHENAVCYKASE